jgi:hypothetical protein
VTFPQPGPRPGGFRPGPPPGGPRPYQPAATPNQAGSGQAGSGQAGSGQAGSGQAGSGQAGSGQAGRAQREAGQAGLGLPVGADRIVEETGHPAVDAVLRSLANAARLAPAAQVAEYEAAHQVLQETLAGIDG